MDSVTLQKVKCGVRFLHTFFYFTLQKKGKCGFFKTYVSILRNCVYARECIKVFFYLT